MAFSILKSSQKQIFSSHQESFYFFSTFSIFFFWISDIIPLSRSNQISNISNTDTLSIDKQKFSRISRTCSLTSLSLKKWGRKNKKMEVIVCGNFSFLGLDWLLYANLTNAQNATVPEKWSIIGQNQVIWLLVISVMVLARRNSSRRSMVLNTTNP